jgi:hypothetical protein
VKKHLRFRKNLNQHHLKSLRKNPLKSLRQNRQKINISFGKGVRYAVWLLSVVVAGRS